MTKKAAEITVKVQRLAHGDGLPLPSYQSDNAAGLDLVAALAPKKPVKLAPGERALIPTGLSVELPKHYEGQVRPRSGLALKHGITVLNTPGTIDSDYRGEVGIILINLGSKSYTVWRGERIAQLVIAPVTRARVKSVAALSSTTRGQGGFGSTGIKKRSASAKTNVQAKRKSGLKTKPTARKAAKKRLARKSRN